MPLPGQLATLQAQAAENQGDPYLAQITCPFATQNLAIGANKAFTIPLNLEQAFNVDGIGCDMIPLDPQRYNPIIQDQGVLVNFYDSRNLKKWILPDAMPITAVCGTVGARLFRAPTCFYVPAGQDLLVSVTNNSQAPLTVDMHFIFYGTIVKVPDNLRYQ